MQGAPKERGNPLRRGEPVLGEALARVFQGNVNSPSLEVLPARLEEAWSNLEGVHGREGVEEDVGLCDQSPTESTLPSLEWARSTS